MLSLFSSYFNSFLKKQAWERAQNILPTYLCRHMFCSAMVCHLTQAFWDIRKKEERMSTAKEEKLLLYMFTSNNQLFSTEGENVKCSRVLTYTNSCVTFLLFLRERSSLEFLSFSLSPSSPLDLKSAMLFWDFYFSELHLWVQENFFVWCVVMYFLNNNNKKTRRSSNITDKDGENRRCFPT